MKGGEGGGVGGRRAGNEIKMIDGCFLSWPVI